MLFRNCFIFIYLLVTIIIFLSYHVSIVLWFSFFSNAIILTAITYYHIFIEKDYSPFLSTYIVFNYLFFLVAPMSQSAVMIDADIPVYSNMFPFNESIFVKTNFYISLFHIVFILIYIGAKSLIIRKQITIEIKDLKNKTYINVFIFVLLSAVVTILNYDFIVDELTRPNWVISDYNISDLLIRKKVLFLFPLAGIVQCISYLKQFKVSTTKWTFLVLSVFLLLFLLFILKNPLTEKRNALGPIYLLLIFLFYPKLVNSNVKTSLLLFFAMIVAFPAFQFLTHVDYGLFDIMNNPSLIFDKQNLNEGYMSLNYDAFINFGVTMEYVEIHGFSFGYQLLSALLFFVPRSLWASKPDPSGMVIGEHLIENHDFWFSNLSNPLVSEGYLNFGLIGIVIMAFILATTIVYFITWLNSRDYFKKAIAFYFAMHMIFLLRGDLTNGYSYFIGTMLGLYFIPKIIVKSIRFFLEQKIWIQKKA